MEYQLEANKEVLREIGGIAPTSKLPGPVKCAGEFACSVSVLVPVFHAVIDVFPAGIGQKHRPVIGFAGFHGIEGLYLGLSVFEQRGGDLRGDRFFAFLKKSVILSHNELAGPVSTVVVFPALVDGLTAAGAHPDCHTLGLKQFLLIHKVLSALLA